MAVDPWQITTGLLALLLGLGSYVAKQYARQLERHDSEIGELGKTLTRLEAVMLHKDDLRSMESRMMATLTAQHTAIVERAARTERSVDKAHERIDALQAKGGAQ